MSLALKGKREREKLVLVSKKDPNVVAVIPNDELWLRQRRAINPANLPILAVTCTEQHTHKGHPWQQQLSEHTRVVLL